jgi:Kdo2-lipid IVA lauroyltransferase/acyltransferase
MYYIIYGTLYIFSLLPLPLLYLFSELAYFILYRVIKYRRTLVMSNLLHAFPEKSEQERIKISKQFYRNLTDTFIESLKLQSMGKKGVRRMARGEYDIINDLIAEGYNIHILAGHQFNWEFANLTYALHLKIPFFGVYMPITNKTLNRIFYRLRKRYGTILISAHEFKTVKEEIFNQQYVLALAADQNPGNPANAYWMDFMNRPAPFVTGPSKGAVRNKAAVVMASMHKPRRGRYVFKVTLITKDGSQFTPEQLTVLYKKELENIIRSEPPNYLWSHRRWRHEYKPEYGPLLDNN